MSCPPDTWEDERERIEQMTREELIAYIKVLLEETYSYWERSMGDDL